MDSWPNIIKVAFLESDYIDYNPALNVAAIHLALIIQLERIVLILLVMDSY